MSVRKLYRVILDDGSTLFSGSYAQALVAFDVADRLIKGFSIPRAVSISFVPDPGLRFRGFKDSELKGGDMLCQGE